MRPSPMKSETPLPTPPQFLKSIAQRTGLAPPPFDAALTPDGTVFAVGDIHGRADLLDRLIDMLPPEGTIVFLGDYVDRGQDSSGVLRRLFELETRSAGRITCLMGNHERMMLNFMENPEAGGDQWLRNGGRETLASFGFAHVPDRPNPVEAQDLTDGLRAAVGTALHDWLAGLPLQHQSGNVHFVHAGANPTAALDAQRPEHLIWGHPAFHKAPRRDGQCVVHGHTIVDEAHATDGRIATDTGAWFTDRLTAARICPGGVTFMATAGASDGAEEIRP